MLSRVHLAMKGFKLTILVVIGTVCTGSCKFNYHKITTTTVPYIGACNILLANVYDVQLRVLYFHSVSITVYKFTPARYYKLCMSEDIGLENKSLKNTNGVIRSRKSKKDGHYNGQKLHKTRRQLYIDQHSGAPEGCVVPLSLVEKFMLI